MSDVVTTGANVRNRAPDDPNFLGSVIFALLAVILPGFAVVLTVTAISVVNQDVLKSPEVQLPIVLIATVLALIGGLTFMVIVLHFLRLTTKGAALGMPDGSIRAVIAISLLFLFMILSVFLYENMVSSTDPTTKSASADVAKQLVTTVATLAVSVAGFYFGTSSVAAASRAVGRIQPGLLLVSPVPAPPMARTQGTASPDIHLLAVPGDQAITSRIVGDSDGELVQKAPGIFTYRRGTAPSDTVVLEFSLVGNPDLVQRLEINAA